MVLVEQEHKSFYNYTNTLISGDDDNAIVFENVFYWNLDPANTRQTCNADSETSVAGCSHNTDDAINDLSSSSPLDRPGEPNP